MSSPCQNGGCYFNPNPCPCGPGQPNLGSVCLPIPEFPFCSNPYTCDPCCGPNIVEPPQMMVAYRKPFTRSGKEEYQCYPCFFKHPEPCKTICCPELQFNPYPMHPPC